MIIMSADLIKAAKAGDVAEARRCLDAGADGKRNEALMEAARCGHAEVAALLIERGANASYGSEPCGNRRYVATRRFHATQARSGATSRRR